jgi:nucleoside-diphosphate-sugar epimerase
VSDVAHLYRLAVEKAQPGARYNAVAEEAITARQIAEAIGKTLNVPVVSITPEQAKEHFGWLAMFMAWDMPASSAKTRELLRWNPTGPGLITDLENLQLAEQVGAK